MPYYTYQSVDNPQQTYELMQSIHDEPFEVHPKEGHRIRKILVPSAIIQKGIRKTTIVNKKSPAATACGCASNAALAAVGLGKATPRYNQSSIAHSHSHSHGHGHSHSHGHGHSHGHIHGSPTVATGGHQHGPGCKH